MNKPNIAILGATGVVGREITKIAEELDLDFNEIKSYDEFSYDLDKEEVVIVREPPHPDYSNLNLISTKSNRGCIITNIKTLKKLLKLDESWTKTKKLWSLLRSQLF